MFASQRIAKKSSPSSLMFQILGLWQQSELVPIYADALLELICRLPELETFEAKDMIWRNTTSVKKIDERGAKGGDLTQRLKAGGFSD
ncbi:hypothetical protein L207DRAFT_513543 [Hyaloscypha variabilis F]|jgi:hypothetical protein|uniref:Uncharacterized protein n=1 Tax=Hyaloscypha variabilis (strain UAMH 11265 / GT02V1 / F) TaxID=1149755 RepID=A0A2J6RKL6_HYAVF|nr:hypothetical protein L207DRAFT_513543 [Hyaloscypha variabilis F]